MALDKSQNLLGFCEFVVVFLSLSGGPFPQFLIISIMLCFLLRDKHFHVS